eukprot:TRINITY_DN6268_c0_g1_i1.p1 TRINITY_DN6268_c0_g1~~TRINITY_DN6268_c0_g1_i1.p1  ORF type:complete len:1011 (-),score=78.33 TRINITY_DN6268_c0_g1_i1:1105-4137(-)
MADLSPKIALRPAAESSDDDSRSAASGPRRRLRRDRSMSFVQNPASRQSSVSTALSPPLPEPAPLTLSAPSSPAIAGILQRKMSSLTEVTKAVAAFRAVGGNNDTDDGAGRKASGRRRRVGRAARESLDGDVHDSTATQAPPLGDIDAAAPDSGEASSPAAGLSALTALVSFRMPFDADGTDPTQPEAPEGSGGVIPSEKKRRPRRRAPELALPAEAGSPVSLASTDSKDLTSDPLRGWGSRDTWGPGSHDTIHTSTSAPATHVPPLRLGRISSQGGDESRPSDPSIFVSTRQPPSGPPGVAGGSPVLTAPAACAASPAAAHVPAVGKPCSDGAATPCGGTTEAQAPFRPAIPALAVELPDGRGRIVVSPGSPPMGADVAPSGQSTSDHERRQDARNRGVTPPDQAWSPPEPRAAPTADSAEPSNAEPVSRDVSAEVAGQAGPCAVSSDDRLNALAREMSRMREGIAAAVRAFHLATVRPSSEVHSVLASRSGHAQEHFGVARDPTLVSEVAFARTALADAMATASDTAAVSRVAAAVRAAAAADRAAAAADRAAFLSAVEAVHTEDEHRMRLTAEAVHAARRLETFAAAVDVAARRAAGHPSAGISRHRGPQSFSSYCPSVAAHGMHAHDERTSPQREEQRVSWRPPTAPRDTGPGLASSSTLAKYAASAPRGARDRLMRRLGSEDPVATGLWVAAVGEGFSRAIPRPADPPEGTRAVQHGEDRNRSVIHVAAGETAGPAGDHAVLPCSSAPSASFDLERELSALIVAAGDAANEDPTREHPRPPSAREPAGPKGPLEDVAALGTRIMASGQSTDRVLTVLRGMGYDPAIVAGAVGAMRVGRAGAPWSAAAQHAVSAMAKSPAPNVGNASSQTRFNAPQPAPCREPWQRVVEQDPSLDSRLEGLPRSPPPTVPTAVSTHADRPSYAFNPKTASAGATRIAYDGVDAVSAELYASASGVATRRLPRDHAARLLSLAEGVRGVRELRMAVKERREGAARMRHLLHRPHVPI